MVLSTAFPKQYLPYDRERLRIKTLLTAYMKGAGRDDRIAVVSKVFVIISTL
jgi:hypothetical protein